jgi:hypothetical protein
VWERTDDEKSDFAGSIMHRPACAAAVGRANLDLNRLSDCVTALQRERPQVALLYSYASIAWSQDYLRELAQIYTALDLSGLRVGFISERQLAEGKAGGFRLIVVPAAPAVTPEAYAALRAFAQKGGALALIGENALAMNHFGEKRDVSGLRKLPTLLTLPAHQTARDLWPLLPGLLDKSRIAPPAALLDAAGGERAWGVEWQCAQVRGALVVNAVNYLRQRVKVMLTVKGKPRRAKDLFSGRSVGPGITLEPMEPALLLIE